MFKRYVLAVKSNSENAVKKELLRQIASKEMERFFGDIDIPVTLEKLVKRGKETQVEKRLMPGYVFVEMEMNDASLHLVKNIKEVTSILGGKSGPQPLTEEEQVRVKNALENKSKETEAFQLYRVGEGVIVKEGAFENMVGVIEAVNPEKGKLKVSVYIFGKPTFIELSFTDVDKTDSRKADV